MFGEEVLAPQGRRIHSLPMRVWTVLVVALGAFLSGCATVPETGRRQVMLLSPNQEAAMGLSAFAEIKDEEEISDDEIANARVQRVGRRIAESVGRELPNADWEFVVFESDELNAFALPGGKVGVYTGILKIAETDAELAAVMGHEIAHVSSRHGAERTSQQLLVLGGALLAEVGMEAKDVSQENRELVRAAYGLGTTVGVMLPYSRLHESEADAIGLRFAAGAGYDPRAAISFWRKMAAANKGEDSVPEFLSTHPSDDTRIKNLELLMPKYLPLYEQSRAKFGN
jgi:predicted Zn-dependent protease